MVFTQIKTRAAAPLLPLLTAFRHFPFNNMRVFVKQVLLSALLCTRNNCSFLVTEKDTAGRNNGGVVFLSLCLICTHTPGDAGFDWSVPVAGDNQVNQKWLKTADRKLSSGCLAFIPVW